jgi:hypothetical protein
MGLSITTAAGPRQYSHFRARVKRDSWPYFTVSDSSLPQPRESGPGIYILQDQGDPAISPGNGFPFRRCLRLAGGGIKPASTRVGLSIKVSLMLRLMGSQSVSLGIKHTYGAYDQTFITVRQLRDCWCGTISLIWGRVCRLQLLMTLASAVIFGSESRETPDLILLSQIRDFHFRCLLRLKGLRWRYSTPPPHGMAFQLFWAPRYIASRRAHRKHRSFSYANRFKGMCLRRPATGYLSRICCPSNGVFTLFCLHGNMFTWPLPNNLRLLCLHYFGLQSSCHNTLYICEKNVLRKISWPKD